VVGSGTSRNYTASLDTSSKGVFNPTYSISAGDQQNLSGHGSLSQYDANVTVTVLGHSAPAFNLTSGGQTVIVGGTANATFTLANGVNGDTTLAPLDVVQVSGTLSGAYGSQVVGSGTQTNYTTALNTTAVGVFNPVYSVSAGDKQTIDGHSGLSQYDANVAVTVLGHSAPAFSLTSGGGQTVIVGASGITANLVLANGGSGVTTLSPLDVRNLSSNLSGTAGSGVVASGSTGTYTAHLTTGAVGPQNLPFGLDTGDQQSLAGADGLTTKTVNVALTVLNHSQGSFNGTTLLTGTTWNLGNVAPNSSTSTLISLFNALNLGTDTAGLIFDSLTPDVRPGLSTSGLDTTSIGTVTVGNSKDFTVTMDVTGLAAGVFTRQLLLHLGDEDLQGATQDQTLTLNVIGNVIPEPATLALVVLGGLGILARRRRTR
jgi:hypothetical protein